MQYSDTSTLQGLVQDTAWWCGSNSGTLPGDYAANDCLRNIREWYRKSITWWLKAKMTGWEFMDNTATINLVASTRGYQLSSSITDLIQIKRLEISYNGTNWYKAEPISMDDFQDSALNDSSIESLAGLTDTTEPKYLLREDYIDIYPQPTDNVASGLKIYYTQNIGTFGASTGHSPKIPEYFHRILSMGAAYDYTKKNNQEKAEALLRDIQLLRQEMETYDRNTDEKIVMQPANITQFTE